jgi:hypothetical protein
VHALQLVPLGLRANQDLEGLGKGLLLTLQGSWHLGHGVAKTGGSHGSELFGGVFLFFETRSHYVAQAVLEVVIFLP